MADRGALDGRLQALHRHCSSHRAEILASQQCGCFYCLEIFGPSEIRQWSDGPPPGQTAECPRCGIDSVLPDSLPGETLTRDLLVEMHRAWF